MSDGFYRAFEDRYRGSRELIRERLAIYLPFVEPLHVLYPDASAVDLGCGRGEWLEVLRAKGISAVGVDLDQGMLNDCHGLGLNVEMGDAIAFLSSLPDESQIVVSGFHIAEHLPFDVLQQLVGEALRVLRPGGILILETPNPENLIVGTSSFYLDPTHARPIPPLLLGFLPEYAGFMRVKTVRLQEPAHLLATEKTSLLDVIGGVSPDYAVIAQKEAEDGIIALTENAFGRQYGLDLETLAKRFDSQIAGSFQQAERQSPASREQSPASRGRCWSLANSSQRVARSLAGYACEHLLENYQAIACHQAPAGRRFCRFWRVDRSSQNQGQENLSPGRFIRDYLTYSTAPRCARPLVPA